jgi:hypothetical protein
VITDGTFRGNVNEAVASMCVFGDTLYIGTGKQSGSSDKVYDARSNAAELIRIYPDDSWGLIVGEPRRTFEGVKFPLSGLRPGFEDESNRVIWEMTEYDGWLYASHYTQLIKHEPPAHI